MENIAVITVPLVEWQSVKSELANISKSLLELKSNGKSEFLKPLEVCELLKCSRNTYQNYIEKGILEHIKLDAKKYSKVIFKRADIDFFLAQRINAN